VFGDEGKRMDMKISFSLSYSLSQDHHRITSQLLKNAYNTIQCLSQAPKATDPQSRTESPTHRHKRRNSHSHEQNCFNSLRLRLSLASLSNFLNNTSRLLLSRCCIYFPLYFSLLLYCGFVSLLLICLILLCNFRFWFGFMIHALFKTIFVNKGIDEDPILLYIVILGFSVSDFGFFDSCAPSNLICCYAVILGLLSAWSI
jgi:hypothetical protein